MVDRAPEGPRLPVAGTLPSQAQATHDAGGALGANIVARDIDGARIADNIIQFARLLRACGLRIGPGQTIEATQAVMAVGLGDPKVLYWALNAVFVHRRSEHDIFNQAFVLFWRDPDYIGKMLSLVVPQLHRDGDTGDDKSLSRRLSEALVSGKDRPVAREIEEVEVTAEASFSARNALKTRDFEEMTAAELRAARAEIARMVLPNEWRRTRRQRPVARPGAVDLRAVVARAARHGSDDLRPAFRARQWRPAPIVVLCDISGSMETYARILLHFVYALTDDRDVVHTFLFGTRLTHISHLMKDRDPDRAIAKVCGAANDWSGGTRIGACLGAFNQRWARRVLGGGAVVLLFTDGLDRDGADGVERAARRLSANAGRLVWLNPLMRFDGYAPLAAGAEALSRHAHDMRPCHNLRSLSDLAAALSRA